MTGVAPAPSPARLRRRLRYWGALTSLGMLANALAATAPDTVPLLVGLTAPLALAMRLPLAWALVSAMLVGGVLPDVGWSAFCVYATLALHALWERGLRSRRQLATGLLLLSALPGAWLILRGHDRPEQHLVSALTLMLCLFASVLSAAQINLTTRSRAELERTSLAEQLAAVLSLALAVPTALALLALNQWLWRDQFASTDAVLSRRAVQMAEDIADHLSVHREVIGFAAAETHLPDRLPDLQALQSGFPGYLTLLLTDADGRIVHYYAPAATGFGGDVSDRAYFQMPRRNGESFVSDVFRGRGFGNDILVAVSAPHVDADGRFAGIVQGALSLQQLATRLQRRVSAQGLDFAVLDRNGSVVATSLPSLAPLTTGPIDLLQTQDRIGRLPINPRHDHFLRSSPVTPFGWQVYTLQALDPVQYLAARTALMMVMIGLLLILALPQLSRRIAAPFVRPLNELIERIRGVDLESAGGLRPLALQADSSEFAELQADFNAMLLRLQQLTEQLRGALSRGEQLNVQLEQKVIERTLELSDALHHAEELARSKSTFLANMSHELRTPLTAIMGYAELALREPDDGVRREEALHTINRNGKHLLGIVNDILDASRIDAGQMVLESIPLAPVALVDEAVHLFEGNARERGIMLECELHWPLPASLQGDPLRLRQVLINLIGNAVKFTERGHVQVVVHTVGDQQLLIEVRDTGVGMDDNQVHRLFRAFEQADASTTRRFGGSGLGLYICHELILAMGGQIEVDSTPGVGTTFALRLPLPSSIEWIHERPLAGGEAVQHTPRLQGHVLVVDDVADLRFLVEQMVQATGASTDSASHGREAVEKALGGGYELILMDMHMPVMDGREATQRLRDLGYRGPIVAVTADVLREDVDGFLQSGCDEVLGKPVSASKLHSALQRYLQAASTTPVVDAPNPADLARQRVEAALAEVRQRFVVQLRGECESLQQEVAARESEAVARRLHTLKGSAGTFGFMELSRAAAQAEKALRIGADHAWQDALTQLLGVMADVIRAA